MVKNLLKPTLQRANLLIQIHRKQECSLHSYLNSLILCVLIFNYYSLELEITQISHLSLTLFVMH